MPTGDNLIEYKITPLQAAFFEWCKRHPYARITELRFHEGIPLEAKVLTVGGFGYEVIRFEKVAREEGLLPK